MIHINQGPKPPLASTMCTRRNKGIFQTSVILVLLVCIGYGFYLYSLLQQRVKYLDTKSIHYQAQQQSLSSQLQVVYEDRARLEKVVQKSKSDLVQSQEEIGKIKKQKEEELQELIFEHEDRHNALQERHDNLKLKHDVLQKDRDTLKRNHDDIARKHEALKREHEELRKNHEEDTKYVQELKKQFHKESENHQRIKEDLEYQVQEAQGKIRLAQEDIENSKGVAGRTEDLLRQKESVIENLQGLLKSQNERHIQEKDKLKQEAAIHKDGASKYTNLKSVLKALPANAINLNHPAVANLAENAKELLLDHLGESEEDPRLPNVRHQHQQEVEQPQSHIDELEQARRIQEREEEERRKKDYIHVQNQLGNEVVTKESQLAYQTEQQENNIEDNENTEEEDNEQVEEEEDLSREEIEKQREDIANDPNMIDICSLPPDPGHCLQSENRFAFFPQFGQCRLMQYSGCGGNQNNFRTPEDCEETCRDPSRRYIPRKLSEEQQYEALRKQETNDQELLNPNQHLPHQPNEDQDRDDQNQEYEAEEDPDENPEEQGGEEEEENEGDDQEEYDEQQRVINQEEQRIRAEEEKARRELERQQQDDGGDGAEEEEGMEDHLAQLKKLSEQQKQMAQDQKNNMQKYLEQQHNENQGLEEEDGEDQIDGVIQDEKVDQANDDDDVYRNEDEEEGEEEGDEEEEEETEERHQQVALPPAVQVAGREPEAVMNLPPRAQIAGEEPDNAINVPPHQSRDDKEEYDEDERSDSRIVDDNAVGQQGQLDYDDDNQQDNMDKDMGQQNNDYDDGDEEENEALQRRRVQNRIEREEQDAQFRERELQDVHLREM